MTAYDIVINANLQGRMSFAFAVERERSVGMKYMVIGILIFGSIVLGWILKNIVWPAIKADPVSNLIMPVATALLTNLLLLWLEMRQ